MKRARRERVRLGLIFVCMIIFFSAALARLVHIQIIKSGEYSEIVQNQSSGKVAIPADRGAIYDRNGQLVAKNVFSYSLYAYPNNRTELNRSARYLEKLFDLPEGSARRKYGLEVRKFRYIKRCVDDPLANRLMEEAPAGLYLRKTSQREYPFGSAGKQILGFTDIDNVGRSGIELACDTLLAGSKGWADYRRDGLRNTYRVREAALVKPVPGTPIILTIDWRLQEIVEQELHQAVEKYNAQSGMAVFLDCYNGDILAAAHFDPDEENPDMPIKLRPVTDQFEPGSVFKAFTAASLLDNKMINFQDTIYCDSGRGKFGRRWLRDDKEHEWLNFRQIMELSSNIGIGRYAVELGSEPLMETYRRFGFGEKLRCGLPGEASGRLVPPVNEAPYNIAALSIGHSVAVTPLQLAAGFAAIANGGELVRPHVVLGEVDADGYVNRIAGREVIGRAFNKSSVDSLQSFLRGVVERGTATPANSPVIQIAGKTGTAEIPDLVHKRYFKHKFNASFAGFFPYETPLVAGIVVLENPKPVTYGGWTSGPTFRRIAERYSILNPDLFTSPERLLVEKSRRLDNSVEVPNFIDRDIFLAQEIAAKKGIKIRSTGDKGMVVWQFPAADRLLFDDDVVLVAVDNGQESVGRMADLVGLPLRKVIAYLTYIGIDFTVSGNGRVVSQSIPAGEKLVKGSRCWLSCRPG